MLNLWEQWAPVLESAVGNTFYALLALLLLSAASLRLQNRARPNKLDPRTNIALGVLMGLRLIELPVFIQAWLGQPAAQHAQAPLERGILLVSIVILAWLWARPSGEGRRRQLFFSAELIGALVAAALLLYLWQLRPSQPSFNYSNLDYAWSAAALVAILLGLAQIFTSATRPVAGMVQLGILLTGQLAHLFLGEPFGNMPLAAEIAQLLSLVFLFALPTILLEGKAKLKKESEPAAIPVEISGEQPAFFDIGELDPDFSSPAAPRKTGPLHPAEELAKQVAEKLHANLALLATMNDAQKQLELQYGYNLVRTAPIESRSIPLGELPRLASALQRNRSLRLAAEPRLAELAVLSQALRLSFPGNLLVSPFNYAQDLRRWAVLLINVERPWQLEDEVELEKTTTTLGSQLAIALGLSEKQPVTAELMAPVTEELSQARQELEELASENLRYREDIDRLLAHVDELQTAQAAASGQVAVESGDVVDALQKENVKLKTALASLESSGGAPVRPMSIAASQAKEELRLAMEELAGLQAKLDAAQQAMLESGGGAAAWR